MPFLKLEEAEKPIDVSEMNSFRNWQNELLLPLNSNTLK